MLLASYKEACLCSFMGVDHCSVVNTNDPGTNPKYFLPKVDMFIPNKLYSVQDPSDSMKASDC